MAYFRNMQGATDLNDDEYDVNEINEETAIYDGPGIQDKAALIEMIIFDEASRMSDEERLTFLNSETMAELQEAGGVGKRSIVRMNKMDDFTRRKNLASLQKAKEMGDADWEALRKNRIKERQLLERIYKKYGSRVQRDVQVAQRQILQVNPQIFNTMRAVR